MSKRKEREEKKPYLFYFYSLDGKKSLFFEKKVFPAISLWSRGFFCLKIPLQKGNPWVKKFQVSSPSLVLSDFECKNRDSYEEGEALSLLKKKMKKILEINKKKRGILRKLEKLWQKAHRYYRYKRYHKALVLIQTILEEKTKVGSPFFSKARELREKIKKKLEKNLQKAQKYLKKRTLYGYKKGIKEFKKILDFPFWDLKNQISLLAEKEGEFLKKKYLATPNQKILKLAIQFYQITYQITQELYHKAQKRGEKQKQEKLNAKLTRLQEIIHALQKEGGFF